MSDKREAILVRLTEILESTATSEINVYRDRAALDDTELPAYVLLDGNEETGIKSSDRRGPQVMVLTPQIFWVPKPPDNQLNEGIGPALSDQRVLLINAIMGDDSLKQMVGVNGYVEYRGMETDMNTGAEVKGQFKLDFAIAYVLNFNKL